MTLFFPSHLSSLHLHPRGASLLEAPLSALDACSPLCITAIHSTRAQHSTQGAGASHGAALRWIPGRTLFQENGVSVTPPAIRRALLGGLKQHQQHHLLLSLMAMFPILANHSLALEDQKDLEALTLFPSQTPPPLRPPRTPRPSPCSRTWPLCSPTTPSCRQMTCSAP